jgi:hypothetical protein
LTSSNKLIKVKFNFNTLVILLSSLNIYVHINEKQRKYKENCTILQSSVTCLSKVYEIQLKLS